MFGFTFGGDFFEEETAFGVDADAVGVDADAVGVAELAANFDFRLAFFK